MKAKQAKAKADVLDLKDRKVKAKGKVYVIYVSHLIIGWINVH